MKNWFMLFGAGGLFLLVMSGCRVNPAFVAESAAPMQEISYTTTDQVVIYGSWIASQKKGPAPAKAPVVLLLHDYGLDRRDWGVFIPDLVQQGFNVLAIDLRGHGKSTGQGGRLSGQYSSAATAGLLQTGYLDVQAALAWIQQQKDINPRAIALVGVGLGADITYACAKKFSSAIRAAVVISPTFAALTESTFGDHTPQAVLFCVSSGEVTGSARLAVESLANFTNEPKKVVVYQSDAHGLAIFYRHPEIKQEILAWLRHY